MRTLIELTDTLSSLLLVVAAPPDNKVQVNAAAFWAIVVFALSGVVGLVTWLVKQIITLTSLVRTGQKVQENQEARIERLERWRDGWPWDEARIHH